MSLLKKNTNRNRVIFMTDSSDHVSGKASLALTISMSRDGAAFTTEVPVTTELANGWYNCALTNSHTSTLGDLAWHVTASGADASDLLDQIVTDLPGDTVASVTGSVGSVTGGVTKAYFDSIMGSPASNFQTEIAAIPTNPLLTSDSRLNNLDATISSRLDKVHFDSVMGSPASNFQTEIAAIPTTDPWTTTLPGGYSVGSAGQILATRLQSSHFDNLIGIPAGASIAADLAEIEGETDGISAIPTADPWSVALPGAYGAGTAGKILAVSLATSHFDNLIGIPAGKDVSTDIAEIEGETDAIPGAVWDVVLASHLTAGTTGNALNAAGSAGDPWATSLPGAYGTGSAGKILATTLNSSHFDNLIGIPAGASVSADIAEIEGETDGISAIPTNPLLTSDSRLNNLDTTVSSRLDKVHFDSVMGSPSSNFQTELAAIPTGDIWITPLPGAYGAGTAGKILATTVNTSHFDNLIGIPAGKDVSTDIAELDTLTDSVLTTLGTPAGASVSADIAEIEGETDQIVANAITISAIANITTQFSFTSGNVNANSLVINAQVEMKKNTAVAAFEFPMRDTSGNPLTGLSPTAKRSIDGGAVASCANAPVEVGSGLYKVDLAASDLNGNVIGFIFAAGSAAQTEFLTVRTQT